MNRALTWICIAGIAGGFALALPNLGLQPFWVDETVAVTPALSIHEHGLPTTRFELDFMPWQLKYGLWDPATPLYRYAVAGFTAVVGFSETTTRGFSVGMALGCALVLLALGRRLYDARTGFVAAALLMTAPAFLVFAREARHFTFVMFFALCTLLFLYRAARDDDETARVLWVVCAVALLLSQTLGYLFLPVIGLYVLLNGPRRFLARRWPLQAAAVAVYVAVIAVFWDTLPFFHVTDCTNREAGCRPEAGFYPNVLRAFLGPIVERHVHRLREAWSLQHVLFAVGVVAVARDVFRRRRERAFASLMLLWLLLPPLLLASREVKFPRYLLIWSAPVCALLVAVAILRVAERCSRLRPAVEILLVVLALASPRMLDVGTWQKPQWRPRSGLLDYVDANLRHPDADNVHRIGWQVAQIRTHARPEDLVVTSLDDASLAYYLDRPVYGFLNSQRIDADFLALLARADATGAMVWFFDSLPDWNYCLTDTPEPRSVDCREKYAGFYARCLDPEDPDAPTCLRLPIR